MKRAGWLVAAVALVAVLPSVSSAKNRGGTGIVWGDYQELQSAVKASEGAAVQIDATATIVKNRDRPIPSDRDHTKEAAAYAFMAANPHPVVKTAGVGGVIGTALRHFADRSVMSIVVNSVRQPTTTSIATRGVSIGIGVLVESLLGAEVNGVDSPGDSPVPQYGQVIDPRTAPYWWPRSERCVDDYELCKAGIRAKLDAYGQGRYSPAHGRYFTDPEIDSAIWEVDSEYQAELKKEPKSKVVDLAVARDARSKLNSNPKLDPLGRVLKKRCEERLKECQNEARKASSQWQDPRPGQPVVKGSTGDKSGLGDASLGNIIQLPVAKKPGSKGSGRPGTTGRVVRTGPPK